MKSWITKEGKEILLTDMNEQHLRNTIKYLGRTMPDHEADDVEVSDHWSTPGVVIIAGRRTYRDWINGLSNELERRGLTV